VRKEHGVANLKAAMAQMRCNPADVDGNIARIHATAEAAAHHGAAAVFFPETVDFGWVNPEAHARADSIPGPLSQRLARLAQKLNLWIGVGLCEKDGAALFDAAMLLAPDGRIVLKHRKINLLSWLMHPPYTPGEPDEIRSAETPFGRIGMLICADSFQVELLDRLAGQKPDLVYIPYGWAEKNEAWPEHGFQLLTTVQRAARRIGAPVIGPNCVGEILHGEWAGRTFEGLSTAADATGMSLVQGRWNREDLILLDLEL
jgi:predicted amidohydrolase